MEKIVVEKSPALKGRVGVLSEMRDTIGLLMLQNGVDISGDWGDDEFACLVALWNKESGWRVGAYNAGSGAYGIPQALPGSKMASAGADWETNPATQITWGLGYISGRYGTPCGAWGHSQAKGWY